MIMDIKVNTKIAILPTLTCKFRAFPIEISTEFSLENVADSNIYIGNTCLKK